MQTSRTQLSNIQAHLLKFNLHRIIPTQAKFKQYQAKPNSFTHTINKTLYIHKPIHLYQVKIKLINQLYQPSIILSHIQQKIYIHNKPRSNA